MRTFHEYPMMTKTILSSGASALALRPTIAERRHGRFMRAPDHDAGTGGGDAGAAGDAGAGDAGASGADGAGDQGGGVGGGASGSEDQGGAGKAETILGDAASGNDGAGDAGEKGKEGEAGEGEGSEKGDKSGDAAFEVLGAPEAYDLKVPDDLAAAGMTFDKEAFEAVEPVLREMNLSNEAAQKLVEAYAGKVIPLVEKRAGERMDAGAVEMRTNWEKEARADPEIGGAKFDETKAFARQTFVRFGVQADGPFLKLLEESGLGNHPDMLRFVANVGRLTGEAKVDAGAGAQPAPKRLADRIYGSPEPRQN